MSSGKVWQRRRAAASESPAEAPDGSASLSCVGVIGGGVAGLACAQRLKQLGIPSVVFDTGKRGPGGRASSRVWRGHIVDHAAQFMAASDPEFKAFLRDSGVVKRWGNDGRFGTMSQKGFTPIADTLERWVGQEGFGSIVGALARGVDVRQDVWVPPSNGVRYDDKGFWSVVVPDGHGGRGHARFDAIVVAHNGKCAERLTSSQPAQEVHMLLRTNFAANLPRNPSPGSGKFTLNQVYSLLFEVPVGVLPSTFEAAFIEHEPCLRWLSSNTARYGRHDAKGVEAWTALSSSAFGKQHKAPQEFLEGTAKETEVTKLLLDGIERATGLSAGTLSKVVSATKLQLWGAALPINRWVGKEGADFVWSGSHKIGIAGDWFSQSPDRVSTVEAAWLSGVRLAEHVAGTSSSQDVGLELGESGGRFVPVDGDFGSSGGSTPAWVGQPSSEYSHAGRDSGFKGKGSSGGSFKGSWPKGKGKGKGGGRRWNNESSVRNAPV